MLVDPNSLSNASPEGAIGECGGCLTEKACEDLENSLRAGYGEIADLEAQLAENQAAQTACGSDYVRLQELQDRQAELEAALEAKTERWFYLTELKERIDAQNR